ncbi:MFS transporter, partial [Escherichia coli]
MNTHSSTVSLTDNQQAAQERLETSEGRREFWRATVSCWLGTTMEYADFALYGLAAGIIFGDVFFPEAT